MITANEAHLMAKENESINTELDMMLNSIHGRALRGRFDYTCCYFDQDLGVTSKLEKELRDLGYHVLINIYETCTGKSAVEFTIEW